MKPTYSICERCQHYKPSSLDLAMILNAHRQPGAECDMCWAWRFDAEDENGNPCSRYLCLDDTRFEVPPNCPYMLEHTIIHEPE